MTEKEEIPIKAWKNCNQFLTHYGQHVRHLKIRFEFDPENRPIHNIQNFLSIFKVIMTKLVRKQALIETIDISDFKFAYNDCWEATGLFLSIRLTHCLLLLNTKSKTITTKSHAAGQPVANMRMSGRIMPIFSTIRFRVL